MVIRVRGIKAAKLAARLMERHACAVADIRRAGNWERHYWVHCPSLDAAGEQLVLDLLPKGSVVRVEEATYKPQSLIWVEEAA